MLREFLNPRHWAPSANREFFFSYDQVRCWLAAWVGGACLGLCDAELVLH